MQLTFPSGMARPGPRMRHFIALILLAAMALLLSAPDARAQATDADIRPGLLWQKSDLPAVFPLQVKTAPGNDYYMVLSQADTGAAVLAAYIRGGRFFRVLVPPGTFTVHFAYGTGWQGENALFGPGSATRHLAYPEALTFAVSGFATKSGHLLDLTTLAGGRMADATTRPQRICQGFRAEWHPAGRARVADRPLTGHPGHDPSQPEVARALTEADPHDLHPAPGHSLSPFGLRARDAWQYRVRSRIC